MPLDESAADERGGACGAHVDASGPSRQLTERVIVAFYDVYHELGIGFLESVYESAMATVLEERGIRFLRQARLPVHYHDRLLGEFFVDLLVEDCLLVELKSCRSLAAGHHAQVLNYLRASTIQVGLLLNFGPKPEVRRFAFANSRKRAGVGPRSGPLR